MGLFDAYTIMVIDDVRTPIGSEVETIVVMTYRTPEMGLKALKLFHRNTATLNELWLDHDMGINVETGETVTILPVVSWLEEVAHEGNPLRVERIYVHTSNPPAAELMVRSLSRHYPLVHRADLPTQPMMEGQR